MKPNTIKQYISLISESIEKDDFVKLSLINKRNKTSTLNTVSSQLVQVKKGTLLSFLFRNTTNDITKNYTISEAVQIVEQLLEKEFFQAVLYTLSADWFLNIHADNKISIRRKPPTCHAKPDLSHDKIKQRSISNENNLYLKELGIVDNNGQIKPSRQSKFRQINRYIEIVNSIMKNSSLTHNFSIVDMGAGKGYLTFALYDYCYNILKKEPLISGIESRKELVDECNRIARKAEFINLSFIYGTIKDISIDKAQMLIALHACDTATDDAIFRGIKTDAQIILCAPCCHKQIRKQMNKEGVMQAINQFGILKERQAEIITDSIRALIMEAFGYKTKVFEFIETDHTPKNIMIAGIKTKNNKEPDAVILEKVKVLKNLFGIEYHYLEKLLNLV